MLVEKFPRDLAAGLNLNFTRTYRRLVGLCLFSCVCCSCILASRGAKGLLSGVSGAVVWRGRGKVGTRFSRVEDVETCEELCRDMRLSCRRVVCLPLSYCAFIDIPRRPKHLQNCLGSIVIFRPGLPVLVVLLEKKLRGTRIIEHTSFASLVESSRRSGGHNFKTALACASSSTGKQTCK